MSVRNCIKMSFVAVQFLETDEVAIVSQSWLVNETTCKWPPYGNKIAIKRALLEKRAPESNWENHEIFILGVHKTYAGAKKEVDKALQSDSDGDDKTPEAKRQKIESTLNIPTSSSPPIVVVKSECTSCSSSSETVFVPDKNIDSFSASSLLNNASDSFSTACLHNNANELPNNSNLTFVSDSNSCVLPDSALGKIQTQQISTPCIVSVRTEDSSSSISSAEDSFSNKEIFQPTETDRCIINLLEDIHGIQRENTMLMRQLLPVEQRPSSMPALPLQSHSNVEAFEAFLKDTSNFNISVKFFSYKTTRDINFSTRRIMSEIFTDDLAEDYNWAGRPPKKPFKALKTLSLILNAFKENPDTKDVPSKTIEAVIKKWLIDASYRKNYKEKKKIL